MSRENVTRPIEGMSCDEFLGIFVKTWRIGGEKSRRDQATRSWQIADEIQARDGGGLTAKPPDGAARFAPTHLNEHGRSSEDAGSIPVVSTIFRLLFSDGC